MKIAICDDEENGRKRVIKEIQSNKFFSKNIELREFVSGEELVKQYHSDFKADIIFLDIQMDKMNGIESAKHIRLIDDQAMIIFVSSHSEEVFKALDHGVFNFIRKPFTHQAFQDVFCKAFDKYKNLHTNYIVTWKNETAQLNIQDIKYMERNGRYVTFYTTYGAFKADASLNEILAELEPYGFIRTHQGYLVNMNKIRNFDGNDAVLNDGTRVMVSVRKRTEVIRAFTNYIKR